MAPHAPTGIPTDLRARLETARLHLLALFRALDRLDLSASEIPQRLLHQLFELDADFAEALWALDQPSHSLDFRAMLRDTLESLEQLTRGLCTISENASLPVPIPPWKIWKHPSERLWTQRKPTAWFREGTPKTVKHPSDPARNRTSLL